MTKRINALQNRAGNVLGAKGRGSVRLEGAASTGRGNLAGTNWGQHSQSKVGRWAANNTGHVNLLAFNSPIPLILGESGITLKGLFWGLKYHLTLEKTADTVCSSLPRIY